MSNEEFGTGLDESIKLAEDYTKLKQEEKRREQKEIQFNEKMDFMKNKFEYSKIGKALSEVYQKRNWNWKEKQMAKNMAMMSQKQRANAIEAIRRSWEFNKTKKGQENKKRVKKAFTRGILNAMSHSKK